MGKKFIFVTVIFSILVVYASYFVSATDCGGYSTNVTCLAVSGCTWRSDSWGGWCEELNCWNLNTQSTCTTTNVPGKNCTWSPGGISYGCDRLSCWTLSSTNASYCVNNSAGLNCEWGTSCYSSGTGSSNCWSYQNQTSCLNATGCSWGQCYNKGCWSYSTNSTCGAAKDWNGRNCTWENNNYCAENGCWRYNQTVCENTGFTRGLNCEWKWNNCQEADCYTWDFTNASACVNNSLNLSCTWSGSFCDKQDCWSYNTQANCIAKPNCVWRAFINSGWCQQVDCYSWDSWNGGNRTACENNSVAYGLNCLWNGNPPGNNTVGWCYKNMQDVSCANKTTERECMDTFYCWWQYNNWSNASAGGSCNTPGGFGGGNVTSIFNEWNPGCYTFDKNSSNCNNILGCTYSGGVCVLSSNANNVTIASSGINCTMINSSTLCNNIPILSSCCAWQNGTCAEDRFSQSCKDQVQQKDEDSCEDAKTTARCEQISGYPWYMPCIWNNASENCDFKTADVFGSSGSGQSLMGINNRFTCEAAGGKWIIENYCEGNVSVPSGRCEYKFDEEDNCDKACFACENRDSNANSVNSSNARTACEGSKLAMCEFSADTNAPNGVGYCKAKQQFKKGIAGDCDSNCGDCTYKGNSNNNDTTKRPSYHCATSKANSDGGGCKWINDNSTANGGYCVKKGEKTCEDNCDRCTTQGNCQTLGRTAVSNTSGSCKWQGSETSGSCVANAGGDAEICWDGIDNNNNNLVDCADVGCFADSFCGLVEGDCFGWTNNNICINKSCEWVTDKWGSFCDFKGSQCWKYDSGSAACSAQTNCRWQNGTGNSWCEKNWTRNEVCMGVNRTACLAANASGCNWTIDSWCNGTGASSTWCQNSGGWCDHNEFKPKNCWMYSTSSGCSDVSGCNWRSDSYSQPHCEVNWSINCAEYGSASVCNATSNCIWETNTASCPNCPTGWCTNKANRCYSYNQTTCGSALGGICYWQSWGSGEGTSSGSCQSICFNYSLNTQSVCNVNVACAWRVESGWCEESSACNNNSISTQETCQSAGGGGVCRWKQSGWCEPASGGFSAGAIASGGGVGNSAGGDCYKYDGNQTLCTNRSIINISCGWMPNFSPKCEVDWSRNCWQYTTVSGGCNATNGCWLKNESMGSYCTNIADQCWNNMSLQNNRTLCSANPYCINNSWGGCEPRCSSQNTTSCDITFCKYMTGWCNPSNMNEMFSGMEAGAAAPLGVDACPENNTQASVDICGFGMKDMGDSYGFGAGVADFSNSSVCNKEELSSFVMGMSDSHAGAMPGGGPGGGTTFGAMRTGSGNDTVIYVVYLDTDGSTTGGCALDYNSSAVGYEFRFKYSSTWNANTSKAVETFNADKCDGSSWKASDVKLSAWKKKMCSDIGGVMIAVKKADLGRFPTLYDSTADMRVSVSTIGNTGNISVPTDRAGPGWTTPGSVDFEIKNVFDYGADSAKFEDILKKGFVLGEDCFNSIDDDSDGSADCYDWDCQYSSKCADLGVNAAGYSDTSSPLVTGVKIEEYIDAALIMYDTNKPTNGTLELYNYGDTQCLNKTYNIYDIGILSANVRDYKLWHTALIYDANNTNISLNWPLAAGSTYNYKLKVCDSSGKCAVSKCSNFTLPSTALRCSYCNFVARIKAPTGWSVSYDTNLDGNYSDHIQGEVCGPNAGMKTNYTDGRRVNIKLYKSDGSTYIEFLNASLTKTGLNDKVRTISGSSDVIHDTTGGFVGLTSETRDKIINNLHPEACRIKIPVLAGGTCDRLYHCDDNGVNCTDRTSVAGNAPINSATCLWNVPNCEFSTYKTTTGSSSSSSSSSSGGGGSSSTSSGGGGVAVKKNESANASKPSLLPAESGTGKGAIVEESKISKEMIIIGAIVLIIVLVVFYKLIVRRK